MKIRNTPVPRPTIWQCVSAVVTLVSAAAFTVAVSSRLSGGVGTGILYAVTTFIGHHWRLVGIVSGAGIVSGSFLVLITGRTVNTEEQPDK